MAEFKKITEVEVVESVNAEDTVLIEQDGVAKRAPKGSIGAQSDWNETDESSPAFIKNKPDVSGGGVMWIHLHEGDVYIGKEKDEPLTTENIEKLEQGFANGLVRTYMVAGEHVYLGTLVGYNINGSTVMAKLCDGSDVVQEKMWELA